MNQLVCSLNKEDLVNTFGGNNDGEWVLVNGVFIYVKTI